MTGLFVALGIMVLALLALLLWFVPHLLQQQATRISNETTQLREMLLDLLSEQEAVTLKQTQLSGSLLQMRDQLEAVAKLSVHAPGALVAPQNESFQQLEARLSELQAQIQIWATQRPTTSAKQVAQDNESWAYLMSLLTVIQERVGTLSQDRANAMAGAQAAALLEELEQEMLNLHGISEDISKLQWRLRRSLNDREAGIATLRTNQFDNAS